MRETVLLSLDKNSAMGWQSNCLAGSNYRLLGSLILLTPAKEKQLQQKEIVMKTILLSAVIAASTGLMTCSQAETQSSKTQAQTQMHTQAVAQNTAAEMTATFAIEKMTCATCPISVKKAMKRVDGVKSIKVDFKTKIATVVYDPALTTPAQIAAASTNVGYPASEVIG